MIYAPHLEILPNILNIEESFPGVLLDAYGVFWGGNRVGLLPGAMETMERLFLGGKVVGILSNASQLAAHELKKLQSHGLIEGKHFHFLITSGEIAKHLFGKQRLPFETPRKKYWLFGDSHPKFSHHQELFENSPYTQTANMDEADFIYVSIPHIEGEDQSNPEIFREKVNQLSTALPMLCINPDRFAHEGYPPRAVVRQGCIASMYEELGGTVFYVGKPSQEAYSAAMHHFSNRGVLHPAEILMVGDTPETDIRGARQCGMKSALVTETGMMADRIALGSLENVVWKLPSTDIPDFFIQRLADHAV